MKTPQKAEQVLHFWLGELDEHGRADEAHRKRWFGKSDSLDQTIRDRFEALHGEINGDQHEDWLRTPRGRLAYIIVLDQFSRNMFRDTAEMFASDGRVRGVVLEGLKQGHDQQLQADERVFFYMPLMHSESLAHQDECVSQFERLVADLEPPADDWAKKSLVYAEKHRDFIRQWGRFPHRNETLGRESTAAEKEFLSKPGTSF